MRLKRFFGFIPGVFFTALCFYTSAAANTFAVTNTNDSGPGSFRQAVLDAGSNSGADLIVFSIGTGVQRIELLSPVNIDSEVEIDGNSQPGTGSSPRIEIRKNDLYQSASGGGGLVLSGGNVRIHGIRFLNFVRDTAWTMALELTGSNNSVYGNVFGSETGAGEPNDTAIRIVGDNNRIGFFVDGANNEVIVPNLIRKNYLGIYSQAAGRNFIKGNSIVENDLGNTLPGSFYSKGIGTDGPNDGIEIVDNTIFGAGPEGYGIFLSDTVNALIRFNRIGVDATGMAPPGMPPPAQFDGIDIVGGAGNRIFDNVISGNLAYGVNSSGEGTLFRRNSIGLGGDGETIVPNGVGILLQNRGGTIGGDNDVETAGNFITGNLNEQIKLALANDGTGEIFGNVIGLTRKEGNSGSGTGTGVGGSTSSGTVKIGSTQPGTRNVIAASLSDGIRLGVNSEGTGVVNIEIVNNCIGTDRSCSLTTPGFGNHLNGIRLDTLASFIRITDNVIAFNGQRGILIPTQPQANISGNNVEISRNSIFGNGTIPSLTNNQTAVRGENIYLRDLAETLPATPDEFDADDGGNGRQNILFSLSAGLTGNLVTAGGEFRGKASTPFEVQFFYSGDADCASGFPHTESRYLGSTTIATGVNGRVSFNNVQLTLPSDMPSGGSLQTVVINREPLPLPVWWGNKGMPVWRGLLNRFRRSRLESNNASEYSPCQRPAAARQEMKNEL